MITSGGARHPAIPPADGGEPDYDREVAEFAAAHREPVRLYLIQTYQCGRPEADDALQDSLMAIREYWKQSVRDLDKPAAYLYKIAGRRLQRQLGEQARHQSAGDPRELLLATADPADEFQAVDDRLTAIALLRELPLRQRQVLLLRAAGFTEAQMAEIMSIRPGTVKATLQQAQARWRELLQKYADTWEAGVL